MTYKEASNVLDDYDVNFEGHSPEEVAMAFDCAFRALEQEPCEDAVSRQAVEKITWEEPSYTDALNVLTEVRDKIRALPPVTPKPKTDFEDCISRVEVNAVIDKWIRDNKLHYIIPKELNRLYGLLDNIGGAE